MIHHTWQLQTWNFQKTDNIGETVEDFLRLLGGPTWLTIPGDDSTRTRALVTLLHGNEPSGVRALHRWLQGKPTPAVNIVCFIGAVDAALTPPGFAYRTLPGHKDLNRCWFEPFEGEEGQLAKAILERLQTCRPEALLDLHNTSGRSPCYAITTTLSEKHQWLTSLFSHHLVLTDLRLGSLMEATELAIPTITVECGGNRDVRSDQIAFEGLRHYTQRETLYPFDAPMPEIQVFEHPIRVELCNGATVTYASSPQETALLTVRSDADRLNFDTVYSGEQIGWVKHDSFDWLVARDAQGQNLAKELFSISQGNLCLAKTGRILMMTTDPLMASSDCLFYFLPSSNQ